MAHTTYRDPAITAANSPDVGTLDVPVTPQTPLPVAVVSGGSGASASQVQGASANSSTTALNPVDVSGLYMTTAPTLTDGQRYAAQLGTRGSLKVQLMIPDSPTAVTVNTSIADGAGTTVNAVNASAILRVWNGASYDRVRSVDGATGGAGTGSLAMSAVPTSSANQSITPVVGVGVTSLVVKASAGNFYSGSMASGATAGYLILYNATAAPAGGAALTAALTLAAIPVAANSWVSIGGTGYPDRCSVGAVLLFSTSTTTYTVPANAALHMRGQAV